MIFLSHLLLLLSTVLFFISFGIFLASCRFHSSTFSYTVSSIFIKICCSHLHFLLLIWSFIFLRANTPLFNKILAHFILNMLSKTCNLLVTNIDNFYVKPITRKMFSLFLVKIHYLVFFWDLRYSLFCFHSLICSTCTSHILYTDT